MGAGIMDRYREKSGIQHEPGDGKSFHAFRRTVGMGLARAGVPLPLVSQIPGHRSIDSTKQYIPLNDEMLRICCMDMSEYETRKEGL